MVDRTSDRYQKWGVSRLLSGVLTWLESFTLNKNGDDTLVFVSHIEDAIHQGNNFYVAGFVTLDDTDTFYVKLVTPGGDRRLHFRWNIDAGGILETNLYEGAVGGMAGGSDVTPLNNNRNSTKVSGAVVTSGVTVATAKGTLLDPKKVGGTAFKSVIGGSADEADELELLPNTTYFREFISGSDGNIVSFKAKWIEHL